MMLAVARIVCPLVALLIAVAVLRGVQGYDPEPEEATVSGAVLALVIVAVTQAPLALAPYLARMGGDVRMALKIGMLPSAATVALGILDLLPRFVDPRALHPGVAGLLATAAAGYALGFLVVHRARAD